MKFIRFSLLLVVFLALVFMVNNAEARFLSVDPADGDVGSSQSWNRYTYVQNDPIAFVDPNGMFKRDASGRIIREATVHMLQQHPSRPGTGFVQMGYALTADNGAAINASSSTPNGPDDFKTGAIVDLRTNTASARITGADNPMVTNCFGSTLADGEFALTPEAAQATLDNDNYVQLGKGESPSVGNIAVYRTENGLVHAATITGIGDDGSIIATSVNGTATAPTTGPLSEGGANPAFWEGKATVEFYRYESPE